MTASTAGPNWRNVLPSYAHAPASKEPRPLAWYQQAERWALSSARRACHTPSSARQAHRTVSPPRLVRTLRAVHFTLLSLPLKPSTFFKALFLASNIASSKQQAVAFYTGTQTSFAHTQNKRQGTHKIDSLRWADLPARTQGASSTMPLACTYMLTLGPVE